MMRKFIYTATLLFLIVLINLPVQSSTLAELLAKFDARSGEIDTSEASYSQAVATIWINLAAHRVMKIGGYLERRQDYVFDRDSSRYVLPSDFKVMKGIMLKSQFSAQWQSVYNNPLFTTLDSNLMQYTLSWVDEDSAEIHLKFGITGTSQYDIEYSSDSTIYAMPSDFERIVEVLVLSEGIWERALLNPYFVIDTTANSYFNIKQSNDTNYFYVKPGPMVDEDTIRIVYYRTILDGDSLRTLYFAGVADLVALTDTLPIALEMDGFIIDEALSYYEQFLKDIQAAQAIKQDNRSDMGIEKGVREGIQPGQTGQ